MSNPAARLIVWDPETSEEVDRVDLIIRPVISDSPETVVLGVEEYPVDDVVIRPEWAGKKIAVTVSPKAVTSDPMTMALADLAIRMGVPVG